MGGLILCKKKAEIPLYVELSDISIYSMEELCYYLYHNIYAIDGSFFDEAFFEFLKHMGEQALIQRLNTDILSGKNYLNLVSDIIYSVDYYSEEEKEKINYELMEIMKRTPAENRKARADILRERGKYTEALQEYYVVIEDEKLGATDRNLAESWNNIGVLKTQAFRYAEAVRCFERAMDIQQQQEFLDNIICALIMNERYQAEGGEESKRTLKKDMIFKYHIDNQLFEKYARVIEQEEEKIRFSQETIEFQETMSFQGKSDISQYYKEVNRVMTEWKTEYREQERERQSE